ncbi:GNAT family N-acetyltransferase [Paenibacillus harenae]|uniref:GNAT superfamily N-acetyltransferase n=1 Tax=Paenibacillus harenae TaxID=306543 RepID=A0ABT9UAT1_PAEHA|nr:GNAT family N-acetyltransferase [Paenibacillus harenae]MDQ0116749.1 GNAT superfamily N-acetyltransferase [Paenibacillus harenae]
MDETIRKALPAEAAFLSDIAFRSKAFWGYEPEYMLLAKKDLTITEKNIMGNWVFVIETQNTIKGFYELRDNSNEEAELFWLFVDPNSIGSGYGKSLMKHAIQVAGDKGFNDIKIKSDPNAVGFYKGFGAVVIGESSSTVRPDLKLPVMIIHLKQD